jgi:ABC-type phosphate transport system substrate-binding protein
MLLAQLALLSCVMGGQSFADTLIIQGSTTFARRIMEPFQATIETESKHTLTVVPNKSLPGMITLLEGQAHMAMISSTLKSEITALQKIMPGLPFEKLQAHEISRTRVAIALHPSNPVRKASLQQVKRVVLGEINNWSELGGPVLPIRVILVGGGGGVTSVVEIELLDGKPATHPQVMYVRSPFHLIQAVEQAAGAIGFAQLALLRERKLPELVTEAPIEQILSLVTLGPPTPAMNDVIQAARRAAEKAM